MSKIACMFRRTGIGRSDWANTRSTKSGPGRVRADLPIVLHLCFKRPEPSLPSNWGKSEVEVDEAASATAVAMTMELLCWRRAGTASLYTHVIAPHYRVLEGASMYSSGHCGYRQTYGEAGRMAGVADWTQGVDHVAAVPSAVSSPLSRANGSSRVPAGGWSGWPGVGRPRVCLPRQGAVG